MVFVSLSVFNPPFPPRESFTYHNSRSQCGKMSIKWFPIFFFKFYSRHSEEIHDAVGGDSWQGSMRACQETKTGDQGR